MRMEQSNFKSLVHTHRTENTPSVAGGCRLYHTGVSGIGSFRLHGPVVKGILSKDTVDSKDLPKLASTAVLKNC